MPHLLFGLTHSCLEIYLISVVWTGNTFENNIGMKLILAKYLKESCRQSSDEQLSLKCFLNIAFGLKISPKLSDGFGCYKHEWVKNK